MSRGPDAETALCRALTRAAAAAGCAAEIAATNATRWASATFTGARHRIELRGDARLADWLSGLVEAELPLRGHLVADLAVVSVRQRGGAVAAVLEALTVET